MSISTNAGFSDRLSPEERAAAQKADHESLVQGAQEESGRRAAARRERSHLKLVQLEGQQQKVTLDVDGETRQFDAVARDFEFDEPDYDESIPSLGPYIIGNRYEECMWWPFKAKGARAGLKPTLGPKAWSAILDEGLYCMRCLWRHEHAWPDECAHCYLSATHRERAMQHLERVGELWEAQRPNRAQRRASAKRERRTRSGLILPGMAR